MSVALIGADIHDGVSLHKGKALLSDGTIVRVADIPPRHRVEQLDGGTILPGFVDLQVNGGGGVLFNDDPSLATLSTIAKAHEGLGTTALLPTLITDNADQTRAAITAVEVAIAEGVRGIIGLHLEGPHLSVARKGAHEAGFIRPLEQSDMEMLLAAAVTLPNLMLTLAPETVTGVQIAELSAAGITVSLGHSDSDFETATSAIDHGASVVTHLFNAMSQLGSRAPGMVGAALDDGRVSAGLIADGIHVHPATIRAAMAAKRGPGQIFLVTDAMATAGSDITDFMLNGRCILRSEGRLTLTDGTLAGADLDMPGALRVMTRDVGIGLERAISMATSIPAALLQTRGHAGRLSAGGRLNAIHLDASLTKVSLI